MPQVSTVRIKGSVLRELIAQRGLTPPKLAKKIGRHRQSVARLQREGQIASRVFAWQIANALEVDITEFTLPEDATEPETDDAAEMDKAA